MRIVMNGVAEVLGKHRPSYSALYCRKQYQVATAVLATSFDPRSDPIGRFLVGLPDLVVEQK